MGLFKKQQADPISARAKSLNAEIAALEAQIKKLSSQRAEQPAQPRLKSTVNRDPKDPKDPKSPRPDHRVPPREPIFESINHERIESSLAEENSREQRQSSNSSFGLAAAWRRFRRRFQTTPANPKLISYLAAGSIQGLRPLRYEKRVARKRLIALIMLFLFLLYGILVAISRQF